jgi:hypothetical protein
VSSRKTTDNLITLSLTEVAFILVFAVLLLLGSKLILVVQGEVHCRAELDQCASERETCQADNAACKSQLAKVTAKPDEVITSLVNEEKLRLENADLKSKLDAATKDLNAAKFFQTQPPKDPARTHAALELLAGFEKERGESLDAASARKQGEDAAKAAKGLQNCLGQLKNCTTKLGPRGYGHPPCWTDTGGQIQYLFNAALRNDGVAVSAGWPPEREQDAIALAGAIDLTKAGVIGLDEFQARTNGIFQASRSATPECRHYVRLTRSPALKDIDLFNRLRLGVEDHFYKLDLTSMGN